VSRMIRLSSPPSESVSEKINFMKLTHLAGISTYCKDNFIAWGPEVGGGAGGGQGEGLARVWTGILGWSVDLVPLVGEVPGRRGLWVSMGYNGKCSVVFVSASVSASDMQAWVWHRSSTSPATLSTS
jgi:hypothetical protein